MSLAEVIFVLTLRYPRGSCSVVGELLGCVFRMPFPLFSLFSSYFYLRLFFPFEILRGSSVILLAGKWIPIWSNVV